MQLLINPLAFGVLQSFFKLREIVADQVFIDLCQFLEQRGGGGRQAMAHTGAAMWCIPGIIRRAISCASA